MTGKRFKLNALQNKDSMVNFKLLRSRDNGKLQ